MSGADGILQIAVPVADLLDAPDGRRDRQLVRGERVRAIESAAGWVSVRAEADGYPGHLPEGALEEAAPVTHRVAARTTHLYPAADVKSRETEALSFGSLLEVTASRDGFAQTPLGFAPARHLLPLEEAERDPVSVAERFLGTPYLWGGNSGFGVDCSGLVQMAFAACGIPCPRDSGVQVEGLGERLDDAAPLARGDLVFWKGHVGFVAAEGMLLHANAFHMAVAVEPLGDAVERIAAQGGGPVVAHRRVGEKT